MVMQKNKQELMTSYHEAGYILTPLRGKVPTQKAWQDTLFEIDIDTSAFPENFGVVLQDNDLVVDVDPRNFDVNDKPHVRLLKDFQLDKDNCVIVRTGAGGLHIYFKKPEDVPVNETVAEYPGLEFKSKGRQVVGAGSIHPNTGNPYELKVGDISFVPQVPGALLEALASTRQAKEKHVKVHQFSDRPADKKTYKEFLLSTPPASEGKRGDDRTYQVACKGYNLDLSAETALEFMFEFYNPRCVPPWAYQSLKTKVENAYEYAQGEAGKDNPETDFGAIEKAEFIGWDTQFNGQHKKTQRNVVNYFEFDLSECFETVAYDEFRGQVVIVSPLPWRQSVDPHNYPQWSDDDSGQMRYYLNYKHRFDVPTSLIGEAVLTAAKKFKIIHPIRDYLNGLTWDGEKRISQWLIEYGGSPDSLYTREVARKVLIQAVARIYEPGCKVDNVAVLEGAQGIGKSSLVNILGGKYYVDMVIDPHSRDTVDAMRGAWFIEFSEMEVSRRADVNALKAFITRQKDRARLAYGRTSIDYYRQCVFVGTINPDATAEYLNDQTGNRRFWPVPMRFVRRDALEKVRDQLFAEAVHFYKKGEAVYITDKNILREAHREQESRRSKDPWTDIIGEYLEENQLAKEHGFTTIKDIWLYAIKGSEGNLNRLQTHRIAHCLRDLDWDRKTTRHPVNQKTTRAFVRKDPIDGDPLFT